MAKPARIYVCQDCGATSAQWSGRCAACGAWNSIVEEARLAGPAARRGGTKGEVVEVRSLAGEAAAARRSETGISEFDRVIGGGFVPGSALLIGGEPGIGKSTLLLQVAARLAETGRPTLYLSGEEALSQVRLRAERLGLGEAPVGFAAETGLERILGTLEQGTVPDLIVVDSVQTLWSEQLESAPGTIAQLRLCAQLLIQFAKRSDAALVLVGHITKDGQIAGPKVIEHMVDTVLYFEGETAHQFRILRAIKNRFGPTDEIGVFEMAGDGLREVANPSALFLGERDRTSPGTAVFAGIEGTRPVLVEFQALVAPSPLGTPRRAVVGWDSSRLAMLLAVLETRCGLRLGAQDVYLNVAGGLRISEPAADLAAAAALVSSFVNRPLPASCLYFGEVSLSGAIRPVGQMPLRLKEAEKLGFTSAVVPRKVDRDSEPSALELERIWHLSDFTASLAGTGKSGTDSG